MAIPQSPNQRWSLDFVSDALSDGRRFRIRLDEAKIGDAAPAPKSDIPQATPTTEEPTVARIHALAKDGLSKLGNHGEMGAMGVPRKDLPHWDDIQVLPAQMARKPLLDDAPVTTSVIIGPRAAKPLQLDIPLFVSDMSYGALSEEAKTALARGAQIAGPAFVLVKVGCCPKSRPTTAATSMNLPQPNLLGEAAGTSH